MFENKKILILGFARSGYEAAKYLLKHNNEVYLTDMKKDHDKEQMKELEDFEKVINARMKQLFDEYICVDGEEKGEAYNQILKVFMIGYGHGWNDRKEIDTVVRRADIP